MEPHELRLNCLQMAYQLGGKHDAILFAANELMNFVTKGPAPEAVPVPEQVAATAVETEASIVVPEQTADDRIAACGTALEMPESGDLAEATPAAEADASTELVTTDDKAAGDASSDSAAAETEAAPAKVAVEEAASSAEPVAETVSAEASASEAAAAPTVEELPAVIDPSPQAAAEGHAAEATP